jgi:subtilase family serine protease
MKTHAKRSTRLLVSSLVTLPVLGFAAQGFDAASPTTTHAKNAANAQSQAAAPYVLPANVFLPDSSKQLESDRGLRAHTNLFVRGPSGVQPQRLSDLAQPAPADNPDPNVTTAEYPASMACLYGVGKAYAGCAPVNNSAYNAKGGSRAIAIVDAYDNPTFQTDMNSFTSYFGLPKASITKVYANGNGSCVTPPFDSGWALESALDTQWAHAMAPKAKIILVEACSNSYADLFYAIGVAAQQLLAYGGGEVSNSWSGGEFSTESTSYDSVFRSNFVAGMPITYLASAGDSGLGPQFPSVSPWVVSAGGTTVNRVAGTLAFQSESCWAGSGGGTSVYETYSSTFGSGTGPWTNFQYPLFGQSARQTPDISFNADPASGVWVQYAGSWYTVGGTSVSSPSLAGIINAAGNNLGIAPSPGGYYTSGENNLLYAELLTAKDYANNFYDVTTGSNGASAAVGWDACTGVGSPRGLVGK